MKLIKVNKVLCCMLLFCFSFNRAQNTMGDNTQFFRIELAYRNVSIF